jgi:hypothetical protein
MYMGCIDIVARVACADIADQIDNTTCLHVHHQAVLFATSVFVDVAGRCLGGKSVVNLPASILDRLSYPSSHFRILYRPIHIS